jgi:hypothetical protein
MNEWTLPAPSASLYHALIEAEKATGRFEAHKAFLRGGIWRNFMSRYPEANWMHKRMLEVSQRLADLPIAQRTSTMQEHLHRAQANDAYWHGLFGGLYLPHLRRAVWHNLLLLEADLERLAPSPALACRDIDCDGFDEIILRSEKLLAIIRQDGDAALAEFSSLPLAHNFGDTLRRHAESYHQKIGAGEATALQGGRAENALLAVADGDTAATVTAEKNGIASAHDRIAFLHDITPADATPDPRPRSIAIDTLIAADGTRHALNHYQPGDQPGNSAACFIARGDGWHVEKRYTLQGDTLEIAYRTSSEAACQLETQINLAMPSCDGFGGHYILADGSIPGGFGQPLTFSNLSQLTLADSELDGGAVQLTAVPPSPTFSGQPHDTVSQSEAGFEKIMQAVCLTLRWSATGEWQGFTLRITSAA